MKGLKPILATKIDYRTDPGLCRQSRVRQTEELYDVPQHAWTWAAL